MHRAELRLRLEPIEERLNRRRQRLGQASRLLSTVSYQAVLQRGFALVRNADNEPLKRAAEIRSGEHLAIQFADGTVDAVAGGSAARPRPKTPAKPEQGGQGSLF